MDYNRQPYLRTASERIRHSKYPLSLNPKKKPEPGQQQDKNRQLDGKHSFTRMSHGTLKTNSLLHLIKQYQKQKRNAQLQNKLEQTCSFNAETRVCDSQDNNQQQMHWTYRKGAGKIIRQSLESFRAAKATNRSLDSVRIIKMAYQRMENGRVTHEPRESANLKGSCSDGQRLLDQNKLSVTVKVENRTFKIEVKCATVGELVGVLNAKVENYVNGKIVGYKTLEQNLQLDYYLTCAEAEACLLNGSQLVLVPVTQQAQQLITLNSFEILRCVGSGGFSTVYLCRFKDNGQFYAMKVIDKAQTVRNKKKRIVMNERNIMAKLDHPLLARLHSAFESKSQLVFILEYYPGGELFGLVKRFRKMKETVARFYMIQILLGLQEIHRYGIVYRDFKPENILVDRQGHVHIADFGLAKPGVDSADARAYSFCGSPEYMPPEMIAKTGHSLLVDFYSVGALFYELVTGLPPFYSTEPQDIYNSTLHQEITFPKHCSDLSANLKHLLLGLLCKDEKLRIGAKEGVDEVLTHPFFGKVCREDYLTKRMSPPVSFLNLKDLVFNEEEMEAENKKLMANILRSQSSSSQSFVKAMSNFYYDRRKRMSEEPQASPTDRVEDKKQVPYQNNLSSRCLNGNKQYGKKSLLARQLAKLKSSHVGGRNNLSMEAPFQSIKNLL